MKSTWIAAREKAGLFYKNMAAHYNVALAGDEDLLIVSDDGDRAVGFSAFAIRGDILDITFFFVTETCRGGECADYMLSDLEAEAKKRRAAYIRYMMPVSDAMVSYFEKKGFDIFPGKQFLRKIQHFSQRLGTDRLRNGTGGRQYFHDGHSLHPADEKAGLSAGIRRGL